jgi:hypothetical protein
VALELSKPRWLVAVHAPVRDKISRYAIAGRDSAGLLKLVAKVRARVVRQLGNFLRMVSCYEAEAA